MSCKFTWKLYIVVTLLMFSHTSFADTPVALFESHAGNINFVGAQKTRRTQPNTGDSCAVLAESTTNTTTISGIPIGATIKAAHLYWAGSFSTASGSTRTTPDYNITFEGNSIVADRQYTADYDATEQYFNGAEDVTSIVQSRANPNGSYSFSGLSVNTAAPHCTYSVVMAGWALVIIYEDPSEDFRVVNLFEGFQLIYGESVTLIPNNFTIPSSPINGKHAYLTWDGDVGNSGTRNGFNEGLVFNGSALSDANNPPNNLHNSISTINGVDNNSHGVDFDLFTIDSLLAAGQTSATSVYSSGGDQVHLSMEIISVTNTPVSDLAITKSHAGNFIVGQNNTFTIAVTNNGPNTEPGPIVVTDTLPTGLTYVSATGTGWSCGAAGQVVTCTRIGNLANGASTSNITLIVAVASAASPSVINTASVSGTNFDNISGNNISNDTVTVDSLPIISLQKTSAVISDPINITIADNPKRIPGAIVEYTITATNSGAGAADSGSIEINDAIPANSQYVVNSFQFTDGNPISSGLNTNASSFVYLTNGVITGESTAITDLRFKPLGAFLGNSGAGNPSFEIKFQVKID